MARRKAPARQAAADKGERFYIGPACKFGHNGERYTSTNACRQCVADQPRPDREARKKRKPAPADEFDSLIKGN